MKPSKALLRHSRHFEALVALAVTLSAGIGLPSSTYAEQASNDNVVVVRQRADNTSKRLIRGIKSEFRRSKQITKLNVITVSDLQVTAGTLENTLLDSLRSLQPTVIVPLGSHITGIVSDSINDIPIVFAAVFQPESSGFIDRKNHPGGHTTGASLDISPALQFTYFKQIHPKLHKLGLIYSDETAKLIPHASIVAKAAGIELFALELEKSSGRESNREVKKALDSLLQFVDGLWSLADPSVFSPNSTKLVVRQTLRKRIPFMGFSSTIVASGALFALDFDYKDIGRQVGELCGRVLNGANPGTLPVTTPDIVWFHYNEKTSARISIEIPEQLRAVAKEVYK